MIYFKSEQFKIIQGLYYLKSFIGKGKDDTRLDNVVQMKIENGHVIFESNNKSVYGRTEIETISIQGDGILPFIKVQDLIKILSTLNGTTEIEIYTEDNININVNYPGRYKKVKGKQEPNPIVISGYTTNFVTSPKLNNVKADYIVPCDKFKLGIEKSSEIVTPGDPIKSCVCVNVKANPGAILFECINGKDNTMLVFGLPYKGANVESRFFFDATKAKYILNQFSDDLDLNIKVSENFVLFEQDNKKAYLQLTAGAFPNIISFMPMQFKYTYEVNRDELIASLKRIEPMVGESVISACTLELQHIDGIINMVNQRGRNQELFLVNGSPELTKKTFNVQTLIKLLSTFNEVEVMFAIYDNGGVICMPKTNQYIHRILMPRLADKN